MGIESNRFKIVLFGTLLGFTLASFASGNNLRSTSGFYNVGSGYGFGSVGQSYSTATYQVGSQKSYSGLIYILFHYPRNSGADSDEDGMTDWYEDFFGLGKHDPSDVNENPDGDEFTNIEEFIAGTDPLDENNYLIVSEAILQSDGSTRLQWFGELGRRYKVYKTDDLNTLPVEWTALSPSIQGQGGISTFDFTPQTGEERIYFKISSEYTGY